MNKQFSLNNILQERSLWKVGAILVAGYSVSGIIFGIITEIFSGDLLTQLPPALLALAFTPTIVVMFFFIKRFGSSAVCMIYSCLAGASMVFMGIGVYRLVTAWSIELVSVALLQLATSSIFIGAGLALALAVPNRKHLIVAGMTAMSIGGCTGFAIGESLVKAWNTLDALVWWRLSAMLATALILVFLVTSWFFRGVYVESEEKHLHQ